MKSQIVNLGAYAAFSIAAKPNGGVEAFLNKIRNEAIKTGYDLGWKAGSVFGYSIGFQDGHKSGYKKGAITFGIIGGVATIGVFVGTILYFKHKEKKNKQLELRK